uniref:Ternary complex factor MIP1 leucine-zipper domain-containing protein n=1 Tax=Quercus lobata TaxID=97700 RepID=A0A7N2LIA9_QUELO
MCQIGSSPGFEDGAFESAKLVRPAASFYHVVDDCLYFVDSEVSRLQEHLQAERDLQAALEVGLSMSSGQFSSSRSTDSKPRAKLEEIALAEANVAKLKQKVVE